MAASIHAVPVCLESVELSMFLVLVDMLTLQLQFQSIDKLQLTIWGQLLYYVANCDNELWLRTKNRVPTATANWII